MKFLRNLLILLVLAFLVVMTGDYFNLPLWPTDWLLTSYPVEIHLQLGEMTREQSEQEIGKSRFYEAFLVDSRGERIRELHLDSRGVSRCVIQEGRYGVDVIVTVVNEGDWSLYRVAGQEQGRYSLNVDKPDLEVNIQLQKENNLADRSRQKVLQVYLKEGDIDSARILALDLSDSVKKDIEDLGVLVRELQELPVDAYHSKLSRLKRVSQILLNFEVDEESQILYLESGFINVLSRIRAITRARDSVVKSYIKTMNEFHKSGRLMSVLQEWKQLMSNSELSRERDYLPDEMQSELNQFENIVTEVVQLIPGEVETNYNQGIQLYVDGNLTDARKKLTRLMSFIRNLNLEEEYPEKHAEIVEYLQDIEIIAAANHAVRNDDLERALILFDMIDHPNNMVRERIAETQRFLNMKTGRGVFGE